MDYPPCGGCEACIVAQILYAGGDVWPEADTDGTFWKCAGCSYRVGVVEAAARQASFWHGDQKYGDYPYMYHLRAVHDVLIEFGFESAELLTAAALHDVVEDTLATSAWVLRSFGPTVEEMVTAVTDPEAQNREERKRLLHLQLQDASDEAVILKFADRLANVREAVDQRYRNPQHFEMYQKEHPSFRTLARTPAIPLRNALDLLLK